MLASNVGGLLEKDQQLGVEQVAHDGEQHAAAKVAQRHGRQSFKNSWKTPGVRLLLTGECSKLLITKLTKHTKLTNLIRIILIMIHTRI